ncbi:hypothetical protein ACNJ7K_09035 [Rhodococcus aetherivorans]
MRHRARAAVITTFVVPAAVVIPGVAGAAEAEDVRYSFSVDGTSVTNTIVNNTGEELICSTSLGNAPDGVLPPVWEVVGAGQSLYEQGPVAPGTSTQVIADVPAGSYVALASCGNADSTAMWASDYPGIEEILALFPLTSFAVEQGATVVTVPAETPDVPVQQSSSFGSSQPE